MKEVGGCYVRIRLDRSSQEFLGALAGLMQTIEYADPALLEDAIATAHARLKRALQGRDPLAFSTE